MDAPHSHIFKCPRCGGSGKEKLKAGPISTSATCIKCEGRGTFVTAICKFVRMTWLVPDVGGQHCPDSVRVYCAVSVGQNQVQIRNLDTRKPCRLKISDLD